LSQSWLGDDGGAGDVFASVHHARDLAGINIASEAAAVESLG
jgi:hypothetical protein